ncbi:hypothetical protein BFP97_18870 [Roseivirga sp. 4D4]|uniref:ComEC/Rec2 family competence protein n=1 Tax=Roseivirga sp. 4D4 TaxID=1889784 RepID=UPI000852FE0E|nr:ComEC/Rec2 family competence protein [Roseivirga sp. 4D4]OEK03455.1 hypothetical protein BFP97_18870 [Roseivirga sp. 4D4]
MIDFSTYPLLRLTFSFALGIVGFHYLGDSVFIPWYVLILALVAYSLLTIRSTFRYQSILASLAFFMLFGLGTQRLSYYKGESKPDHLLNQPEAIQAYKAVVSGPPQVKAKSVNCQLEVYKVLVDGAWRTADGIVNAYLDTLKGESLSYGDLLFVEGKPAKTLPPANPGEFDYRGYLVYNRIHHQHFIRDRFSVIGHRPTNWFVSKANFLRNESVKIINSLITEESARGIVLALVLGVKDDLQDDVIQAFSATGAMHVLAVSGLHVGIIYAIIFLLLKRLGLSKPKYKWWLAAISILTLWCYALLTGLSPSVLRAVTMFSFISVGQALSRHTNIYNTLAASALALLLYNPYLIMSVGFQLSYLAVFGIVYLQPRLYALIEVNHWLLDKVWAITCVSIAAQLATAPLSILYFHQFPSYFLLSNLFIIPAAFIILISGLLLLITSFISPLAAVLGWLVTEFILLVNGLVFWVSQLPGSTAKGIYISILDTWLIYGLLTCVILFFDRKRLVYLKYGLGLSLLFVVSQLWHFSKFASTKEFSVMAVSGSQVMDFRSGFKSHMISDSLFLSDTERQRFLLHPKRLLSGSTEKVADDGFELTMVSTPLGRLISFDRLRILCLDRNVLSGIESSTPIEVDWLILGKDVLQNLEELDGRIEFDELIIDPSNSWYTDQKLVEQAGQLKVKYHSVRQDGYYSRQWKNKNL